MSLNGLDDVRVTQAYQGALAEAGGWFLLRYTSRDSVEVLTRGAGGAAEARTAVAQYEEKSPLYGLLLYRRRKVLVKYVPDGTSRLLQARVAVHFLAVADRFAPHDVVLEISAPEGLSDSALASACTLHTAAPSSSSSNGSLRQQKLSWIQEAAEEGSQANAENSASTRPMTAASAIPAILEPIASNESSSLRKGSMDTSSPIGTPIGEEKPVQAKTAPEISHVTVATITEPQPPSADSNDLQDTLKTYDQLFEGGPEPRMSSQTVRPDYNELYEHYYAQYTKPKVKLGPRPRQSSDSKRPATSGSGTNSTAKPKSSLPQGLRAAKRKASDQKSNRDTNNPALALTPPSHTPIISSLDAPSSPLSITFSARGPASVRSMPASAFSTYHRSTGMTQEKSRLMKALEMRKKQLKVQQEREAMLAAEAEAEALAQEEEAVDERVPAPYEQTGVDSSDTPDLAESVVKASTSNEDAEDRTPKAEEQPSESAFISAGLAAASEQPDLDDLISSASISSPISAQTQSSSGAPSTRPSSVSEDDRSVAGEALKPVVTQESQNLESHEPEDRPSSASSPTVVPENRTPVPSLSADFSPASEAQSTVQSPSSGTEVPSRSGPPTVAASAESGTGNAKGQPTLESVFVEAPIETVAASPIQIKKRNRESAIMQSKRQSWYETKDKRRAKLEPLQIGPEDSEPEYLSDDSFMEELQSATVQEAKPISVSKSPIAPWFPRKVSDSDVQTPDRLGPQGFSKFGRPSPEFLTRKASGPWPPQVHAEPAPVAKKINVSSGISQRIKALAEKSQRESGASLGTSNLDTRTLAERKSSFFVATPTDSTTPNSRPATRLGTPTFLNPSASSTPEKKTQPPQTVKATVYNVQRANTAPESVQVTARIVRDATPPAPNVTGPSEPTPLALLQSPLVIDHQKAALSPKSPTRGRSEPLSPGAPSAHSREPSIGPSRNSIDSTWRAFGRRFSESTSIHSHDGSEEKSGEKKEKKDSRTSKLFKRMSSSMSSMPWKSSSSNSNSTLQLPENDARPTSLASLKERPAPVQLGDLNVQFPDTLLWKRRHVETDLSGNLVFSPSASNEKGVVKRFHLADFLLPYTPDLDRQELPNSVVLDFIDGRTLQVACGTGGEQSEVLSVLRRAHGDWITYSAAS